MKPPCKTTDHLPGRALPALLAVALCALVAVVAPANGSGGESFTLERQVLGAGGGTMLGGSFSVTGTVGQTDADHLQPASGGTFSLIGGFWAGNATAGPREEAVFANGFENPLQ
ncbi:MAG TPA: hypothetical protein PKZ76_01330 [Xanthomonadaceae bacterium]|nr:hypothetical protein [Xanthomonadaceae bacterium]